LIALILITIGLVVLAIVVVAAHTLSGPDRWSPGDISGRSRSEISGRSRGEISGPTAVRQASEEETAKSDANYTVSVFYGTDRRANSVEIGSPTRNYGADRGEVTYGVCQVTLPEDHRLGVLESPRIYRFEWARNPEKHVFLKEIGECSGYSFFELLSAAVEDQDRAHNKRQLLVFLHGFRTTFEDAALRTAQLAYDLNYEGVPIFWSWPSQGRFALYTYDETNVRWTAPHLEQFLCDIAQRSGASTIHLIAHSMGNRCLTEVLKRLASAGVSQRLYAKSSSQPPTLTPTLSATISPQRSLGRIGG
jgi:esterase/lipase superfamily enzyme